MPTVPELVVFGGETRSGRATANTVLLIPRADMAKVILEMASTPKLN